MILINLNIICLLKHLETAAPAVRRVRGGDLQCTHIITAQLDINFYIHKVTGVQLPELTVHDQFRLKRKTVAAGMFRLFCSHSSCSFLTFLWCNLPFSVFSLALIRIEKIKKVPAVDLCVQLRAAGHDWTSAGWCHYRKSVVTKQLSLCTTWHDNHFTQKKISHLCCCRHRAAPLGQKKKKEKRWECVFILVYGLGVYENWDLTRSFETKPTALRLFTGSTLGGGCVLLQDEFLLCSGFIVILSWCK